MLKKSLVIIFTLMLLSTSPVRADSATGGDIAKELICQCGCLMVLGNCSHAECSSREAMTALINQKIGQGQSGEQIIQSFIAQYGEQVLVAPPKKGFNLTAWLLPFAALLFGGGVVYTVLKAGVKGGSCYQTAAVTEPEENDEEYQRRLEQELAEFTGGSFR